MSRPRFAMPEAMVHNVIRAHHDEIAHCGPEKTFKSISNSYWFPSMRRRIREHIENCLSCLTANISSNVCEGEAQTDEPPSKPCKVIHVDHSVCCRNSTT